MLGAAAIALAVFKRLGLPPVLGYLVAGLLIGPNTPPHILVADPHSLEALSEIGVVFLLFALGVEFNLYRLARVGAAALLGAGIEAGLLVAAGAGAALWLGWRGLEALLLGGVVSIAGTAIVARTLLERRRETWTEIVSGMLIAEDMICVLLIAFFSSAAAVGVPSAATLGAATGRFAVLVTLILTVGLLVLPRVLAAVKRTGLEEVRTLAVVAACFATALITDKLGFSAALGAFLAGAMVSSSGEQDVHHAVAPFRDVFGAVFFVSVCMMIDPAWLFREWRLTLGLSAAVVAARGAVNFGALLAVGQDSSVAVRAALAMLPIGEFSFILAQLGSRQGLTDQPLYPMAVTLCLATTVASAWLLPAAERALEGGRAPFPRLDARLERYRGSWTGRGSVPSRAALAWRLVRPSVLQIILNAALVAGIFLGAEAAGDALPVRRPILVWTFCTLLSLPSLSAVARKLHAVMLVAAEASRPPGSPPPAESLPGIVRAFAAFAVLLTLWGYAALSMPLLPPWPRSALPLGLAVLGALTSWRAMTRVYARLQSALRETLSRGRADPETSAAALSHFTQALPSANVSVKTARVGPRHWAAGRTLGEVGLRAATGTSILQVVRGQETAPAPDASFALAHGDEVLLIGSAEQLSAAERWLESGPGNC